MKVAITGHSAGIGQAISKVFENNGHEIVGLSRRNGYNIRNIPKIVKQISPCDLFINNAQDGFAQTELLFAVYKEWKGVNNKTIINISTMMVDLPVPYGYNQETHFDFIQYYVQKKTLEHSVEQLLLLQDWPRLLIAKPGGVKTQDYHPNYFADPDEWANKFYDLFYNQNNLEITSFGLNFKMFNNG